MAREGEFRKPQLSRGHDVVLIALEHDVHLPRLALSWSSCYIGNVSGKGITQTGACRESSRMGVREDPKRRVNFNICTAE